MTGVFYLLTIVAGVIAQALISERLVVVGDASATAANILAHERLFRLGFTVYVIEMSCQIVMTGLFYELLKPVNGTLSLLSAVFSYVGCGIKTFSRLFYLAPLLVLGGAPYLRVFTNDQLQALALLFLRVNEQAAGIALAFFGIATLLRGYLMVRSTFLPRSLGILSLAGGVGWMAFLYPPLGLKLFPFIVAIGLLGALATIGWLLVVGVDEQRWKEQAGVAAGGR
ncbi:MAG: DUF4386 family protein [Gemmatimonadales bacterium]|nr:DUF4386 family protein [Gemmatimonadales bacterium]